MKVKMQVWIGDRTYYAERTHVLGQTAWHSLIRLIYDIYARHKESNNDSIADVETPTGYRRIEVAGGTIPPV